MVKKLKLSKRLLKNRGHPLLLVIALVVLVSAITAGLVLYSRRDTRDYTNPSYLGYVKSVDYCNQFWGGAKVPPRDKAVYDHWKINQPIPC